MRVGEEVRSLCGACKAATDHRIIAMIGTSPAQVECRECGAKHRFRPEKELKVPKPPKEPKAVKPAEPQAAPDPPVPLAERIGDREPADYHPAPRYRVGAVIQHPTFGVGLVEEETGPGYIRVEFPGGRKILAHDRNRRAVAA